MRSAFELSLPETVYILGSAPSAIDAAAMIPEGACKVALNAAVAVPDLWPTVHMASDWNTVNCKYWCSGQLRIIERATGFKPVYSTDLLEWLQVQPPDIWPQGEIYTYRRGEGLHRGDVCPRPDFLRPNATILGEALQWAWHRGAQRVIVGGCDMHGNKYHDGTKATAALAGRDWHYVKLLDELVSCLSRKGLQVYTLTETRLNLPYWRPNGNGN